MTSNNEKEKLRAPEMVLDLLIASGRPLSVRALLRAGQVMQVGDVAVRVALTRLCEQHKVRQLSRGLYTINLGTDPLMRDVDDWRNRDGQIVPWTGGWVGVYDAAVQRSDRKTWRHHSLALAVRGFAPLQSGLSLRPDNLAGGVAVLREQLTDLGLSPEAQVFGVTEFDGRQLKRATALWDVPGLQREYRALAKVLAGNTAKLCQEAKLPALRDSLLLGRRTIRLLIRDPLLPSELMPPQVRLDLVNAAERYQAEARRLWNAWLEQCA